MGDGRNNTIHDWVYGVVSEVCHDQDYLYRAYFEHFSALMKQIYREGRFSDSGRYLIPGLKSDLEAEIRWQLSNRLNYMGPNRLTLTCSIQQRGAAGELREAAFELSTGAMIP